jgi:alpha-methylacyl-CoA racemase
LGAGWAAGQWPRAGDELVTGGSPRYQIYQTADNKYLAAAPLEDKFWNNFLTILGTPELEHLENPALVKASVAKTIAQHSAAYWLEKFEGKDTCVTEVIGLEQAVSDRHFKARGVFDRGLQTPDGQRIPALPTPISSVFLSKDHVQSSPALGADTDALLGTKPS